MVSKQFAFMAQEHPLSVKKSIWIAYRVMLRSILEFIVVLRLDSDSQCVCVVSFGAFFLTEIDRLLNYCRFTSIVHNT